MTLTCPAIFYDGLTSRRREVEASLHPDGLAIFSGESARPTLWPYAEIRRVEGLQGPGLAITRREPGSRAEPLLEIRDAGFAAALSSRAPLTLSVGAGGKRERLRVVGWAIAAIAALGLLTVYGLPAIAARLAPLIPAAAETRLGEALDPQVRRMFSNGRPLETCGDPAGVAALAELVERFEAGADLHLPLKVEVLDHPIANAFALPGGRVYVFRGLIARARSADELAGVLAHEIGHVKHRHGLQAVVQAGGLGLLLGTVFGDFAGGTAIILASRTLIQSAFSREAEREADLFAVDLMLKAGGDPMGLARFFANFSAADPGALAWIASHPANADRERAISQALAERRPRAAAMSGEAWTALRSICQKS